MPTTPWRSSKRPSSTTPSQTLWAAWARRPQAAAGRAWRAARGGGGLDCLKVVRSRCRWSGSSNSSWRSLTTRRTSRSLLPPLSLLLLHPLTHSLTPPPLLNPLASRLGAMAHLPPDRARPAVTYCIACVLTCYLPPPSAAGQRPVLDVAAAGVVQPYDDGQP